jgi:quercetin dioxygenase-like cupin family protein
MVAQVELAPGCVVASHHHESEQVAVILSGRVRWNLGTPGTPDFLEHEAGGGEVLVLPPNFPHGLVALEETVIIDFLSPPGKMGVDNQG